MPRPKTPLLTVDAIIEMIDRPERPIVLIERRREPRGWAIPGGFVDIGESVEEAAVREAWEETRLDVTLKSMLGVYSDPERDPRGHTVSVVFIAEARGNPRPRSDVAAAEPFELAELEPLEPRLAFDHAKILRDYRRKRADDSR